MPASSPPSRYWFPAKRYGWGWGPPTAWQGWVVLIAGGALELAAALRWMPREPALFGLGTLIVVLATLAICYLKGEPPAWRWGDRDG